MRRTCSEIVNAYWISWTDGQAGRTHQALGVVQTGSLCTSCDLYRVTVDGVVACPSCERGLLPPDRRAPEGVDGWIRPSKVEMDRLREVQGGAEGRGF
jgi:hypothetical protein